MAGECRANRKLGGLGIPRFTDQQNIGILPQEGAQRGRESEANLFANLRLPDAREFIFHRVFQRVDDAPLVIEGMERGVQSRGLSRPRRTSEVNQSRRNCQRCAQRVRLGLSEAQLCEVLSRHRLIQQPDDEALAMHRRQRAKPEVEAPSAFLEHSPAILREAFFRDVHATENLTPREQRLALRHR